MYLSHQLIQHNHGGGEREKKSHNGGMGGKGAEKREKMERGVNE